ncbi:hypothetical protein [uncultured Ligilactobacillus sp.]|uniref:hypothetical protein n=1 Tax=uncultured Ligilactobacillus sp. TaxID=2837633 RepID=UPI00258C2F86|nr:hypothetical protein [uncultured Ligilactobacillus sp.]
MERHEYFAFGEVPYQHEKYSATAAINVLVWLNPCVAPAVYGQNLKNGFLPVIRFEVRRGKQTKNGINV